MKAWSRLTWCVPIVLLLVLLGLNILLLQLRNETIPDEALVDINRMASELQAGKRISEVKKSDIQVELIDMKAASMHSYMDRSRTRIILLPTDQEGNFYRFTYQVQRIPSSVFWIINTTLIIVILFIVYILLYIRKQIIQPFHNMEAMANALKNRDFTYELPQQKQRFFGKFVWAIDVMKEELRHHEEKETELMKEKQTMIASLSHDIKTPLSNIRLYTDAMKEHLYPEKLICARLYENCDKIDQYVKEIMHASNEDLFDFSVHMEEVYLHDVEELLKREKERIELALVAYEQQSCRNQLIYTDRIRLREVIGNVIDNALKYGDGKWIHVSFYEEDHHSILQIKNSGQNIDKTDANAIFQSFYRGSNTANQKGNGLGLYICKQLMRKMDGDIFMTQNKGSVSFHLVLGTL